jgi:F0F1-type ATP synthase membrane subunit c/vacuolar-type H+-ATPase subunit K
MWLFGNLYEQIVWNPQLLADPRPGSLVGVFAAGSPIYYYLPWGPLGVVLAVVTRAPWPALGCLAVSVAMKILLITQVNPVFRDPAVSRDVVHDNAVLLAFGNGVVILAVAAAILLVQRAQRRPASPA